MIGDLKNLTGKTVLFVLKPKQLSILGQVFRPILCAKVKIVAKDFVVLENVNIRMSHAPEFVFPTPLYIPIKQIASYTPFDCNISFPLT